MKLYHYLLLFLSLFICGLGFSQEQNKTFAQDTLNFNYTYWNGMADKMHLSGALRSEFIDGEKIKYFESKHHKHIQYKDEDLVWTVVESGSKGYGQNSTNAINCTNIDFEAGTLTGWTRKTGNHPAIGAGCCPNNNGAQAITTTAMGVDPYGGFPVVFPGGNFSAKIGNNGGGAIADRLEQTFVVSAANANFTYRYAVVLNDAGHNPSEQPAFIITMIDSVTGANIPCTQYTVAASNNLAGFSTSSLTGGSNNVTVIYKPWTSVAMDLTPVIGSTVTIRFTTYDCQFNGHFGYAYVDGLCTNFDTAVNDTTCPNVPITICAPPGFLTTTWNGPGVINNTNSCVAVSNPGTYTCTTLLVPGCPGPSFVHTLTLLPNPLISFTPSGASCSNQYTFNSAISIATGSINNYIWYFGDGSTSTAANPVHNYAAPGLYNVMLKATSNRGCSDSLIIPINIAPPPNLAFSPPSNCINTIIQFTNTSTIGLGSITGYTWNLGNGATSNLVNPTNSYTANGTYTITLTGISNQGCISTLTQTLGIFPPPVISFSASPLCDVNGTSFSPLTSTAIASGSLATFSWNFGDGGTSTAANPVHIYANPGTYVITFSATSNHNCPATTSNTLTISPSPSVAFATTSVNACTPNFTFTNNSSIAAGTVSYTWNFGGTNTTTATSPSYTFPSIGNYTIQLIGTSNLGCGDTAIQYVSIFPYPVVNFSVPASCENAIFTVSTTAVSGSVTSYNWDFGDPASGALNTSTLQSPTHFYSTTNNYIITLNLMSNLNCPSQTVVPITVFPNPVAAFTFSTLNNCSSPYTFTNTSTTSTIGSSALTSFNWNFGAAGTSTLQQPGTINFPSNGTYSVSLIARTNRNCSDTMSTTLLVHPLPAINFTVNPTCENVAVIIPTSSSISPVPSVTSSVLSYTWNFGDNTFANTQNPLPHLYASSNTYSITYSATSDMGCISVVTKTILINPIPVSSFTTTSNMCFGNITTFTSQQSISSGTIFTYSWDFGDGTTGYNPSPSHTYSTSGSFPVTYTTTSNNECSTILTKTVTIHPLPVVSFSANGGCLNTISNFSESCTVATPLSNTITSYLYSFGDGGTVTAQSPARTYTAHGTYHPTLTVGTNQGCFNTNTITLIIHPLPNIVFGPPGGCENSIIQFTNSSSIALGIITSYTWNFGNGFTSNLLNPVSTYPTFGLYTPSLTAISNLGCIKTEVSTLTIHPFPQLTVTPVSNSCKNDTALINTNLFIPAGSIQSYTLSFGDGAFNTFTNVISSYSVPHSYNAYGTFSVQINAVSAAGCARSKDTIIVVYPKPFVNFASSNYCYGDLTVFSNSCTIPSSYSIAEFFWNFNDQSATPTSSLASPSHTFVGLSPNTFSVYPVSLTAYSYPEANLSGNGPVTCSLTTVKNITIFPVPVPSFSANNACLSKPTIFSNSTSSTSPSQTISGYSWYFFNNGQVNSILANPSYVYSSPGTQTVQLVALNSYGCSNDSIQTITVYSNPVAAFTTSDVCLGNTASFLNTTPPPADGSDSSSVWTIGSSTIGLNRDATYSFPAPGTFSVTLTSISTLGCSNKYTGTVTIHPLPNIIITANESCQRSSTTFTNISNINPGSITSYNWDFGDPSSGAANTSTAVSPNHIYLTSGTYSASVLAVSDKNCSASDTIGIIVRKLPSASFTHTLICAGDKLNFSNQSTSADGVIKSNLWDFNGDNVYDIDNPTPSYIYANPGNFNVKLVVTTEFGCSDTMTRLVYSNPKAKAEFTSDNKTGCPPICINFINQTSISDGTPFSTTWEFGDGTPNSNLANPSHCFDAGVFDIAITVVSNVGCISKYKQPGYVSIYPVPTAKFSVYPEEVDEEDPLIEVTGEMGADVDQVRYYINDGSNYSSRNFSHYIKNLKSTKPMVVLIAKNKFGCADTVSKVLEIKPSFVVYFPNVFTPNGDGNNDYYMPKGVGILKFSIQIYDRWGHKVFTSNDISDMWDGRVKENDGSIKEDVYSYKAQVMDIFNKNHNYVGHITVIR